MINPSSAISFGFESTVVTTKNGKSFTGFLVSDADPLILKDIAGNENSIALKDVAKKEVMNTSIMPSVKNLNLSAQEIMDIVAYMQQD